MSLRTRFYIAVAVLFLAPLAFLWGEWSEPSAFTLNFVLFGAMFLFWVLFCRWDVTGYYFRVIFLFAFFGVCFHKGGWLALLLAIVVLLLFWFVLSRPRAKSFLDLAFPLANGWYYIGHGGSFKLINHHRMSQSQRYALDILRLNALGFRANGIYPSDLKAYAIHADVLYGPCDGTVTAVVNDLPDLPPSAMDPRHGAGNHIVICCGDKETYVGLAHLAQGSVLVSLGERVTAGQPLARIGNSGHTSEPHLHIHAKRGGQPDSMLDGEGVAMRFNGRWLIRNSLWVSRHKPDA